MRLSTFVYTLSAGIALIGYLALAPHLDVAPLLAFPLLLGLAALIQWRGLRPPPNWTLNLAAVATFAFYVPQLSRAHLVPAVDILVVLLGLRLLGDKSPRQLMQVYVLSLFALAASTLFDLSPRFALLLAVQFFAVVPALVLLTFLREDADLRLTPRQWRGLLGTGVGMAALSLPLAMVLFLVLPRSQIPLWNFLNQQGQAKVGYTERVQPGAASAIGGDNALVLRVESPPLAREDLYWRGTVLNHLDGQSWERRLPPRAAQERPAGERAVTQRIFREPGPQRVVFALDAPLAIQGISHDGSTDRIFTGRWRSSQRLSYDAESILGGVLLAPGEVDVAFYLQLPADLSPRLRRLADELFADAPTPEDRIARLRRFFSEGQFRYATSDLPTGADPLSRFLLEERVGHCEFFASAFAVLLRLGGIPARLVGGYYGGDYNELGGYYLVREGRAHVWVEMLRPQVGWERIDPSEYAVNFDAALGAGAHGGLRHSLHMALDALEHFWSTTLLTFDLERQVQALRHTRRSLPHLVPNSARLLPWLAALALVAAAGFALRRRHGGEDRLARRYLALARKSLDLRSIPPQLGFYEIAERLDDPAARQFAALYGGALYGERPLSRAQKRRLSRLLREMKKGNQRNSRR